MSNAIESKEFEVVFNAIPAMIFYKDRENRFVRTNAAFEKDMGLSKEKLEGRSLFEIYPEAQARKYWEDDKKVMESGQPCRNIIESMETSHGTRWVQTDKIPYRDAAGNIIGIIGFSVDITESRLAAEELRQKESTFRVIASTAQDAIMMMDHSGCISFWNLAAERFFGWTEEEAMGKDLHELLAPKRFLPAHKKAFPHFQETGEGAAVNRIVELAALREDGTEMEIELSLSPVKIDGKWHAVGILRDIGGRKIMEEELRKKLRELESLRKIASEREMKIIEMKKKIADLEAQLPKNS